MKFLGKIGSDLDIAMVFKINNISCLRFPWVYFHLSEYCLYPFYASTLYVFNFLNTIYMMISKRYDGTNYRSDLHVQILEQIIYDIQTLRRHRLLKCLACDDNRFCHSWWTGADIYISIVHDAADMHYALRPYRLTGRLIAYSYQSIGLYFRGVFDSMMARILSQFI